MLGFVPHLGLFVGLSALCAQQPHNQDSIEMCGVTLRIGLPQDGVLKSLAVQCTHLSTGDDGTSWLIATKDKPPKGVGTVFFKAGRLSLVGKFWEEGAKAPVDVGDALYFAAAHFLDEGRRSCSLGAFQNEVPELRYKRFSVICGRKELRVSVSRAKEFGDILEVEELLR